MTENQNLKQDDEKTPRKSAISEVYRGVMETRRKILRKTGNYFY